MLRGWAESSNFWLLGWRILPVGVHSSVVLEISCSLRSENPDTTEIGDLKGLNSNARVMIKMALFSAWARLQMASTEQQYLTAAVQPCLAMLTPLWLSSLKEFARLRFEPDISGSLGTPQSGNLDEVYAALNRETLLKVKDFVTLS